MNERTSVDPVRVYAVIAKIYSRRENVKIKVKLKNTENGIVKEIEPTTL
jgi:hypothetical protein